ncbi:MAG: type II secretion system protein [Sulfurimonas sp.]|uniref:type II secretion system protein n=1 Tax=Sulfurimonas sp. TaxID=2022749 RepID=UPI003D10F8B2
MVRRKTALSRFAFTMIELIFAIVVIAIAVMSLPMMLQITSKGIEDNIVQEAIFAASAELMGATSYYWDNNRSMEDMAFSRLERVVDVDGDCNASTRLRPGHINQPFHRRCLDSNNNLGVNYTGGEATGVGLNRSVHAVVGLDNEAAEASGYKQEYKSQMAITQGLSDNNVKVLTASVFEDDGVTLLTRLRIYSANIGEIDYYKRKF